MPEHLQQRLERVRAVHPRDLPQRLPILVPSIVRERHETRALTLALSREVPQPREPANKTK